MLSKQSDVIHLNAKLIDSSLEENLHHHRLSTLSVAIVNDSFEVKSRERRRVSQYFPVTHIAINSPLHLSFCYSVCGLHYTICLL